MADHHFVLDLDQTQGMLRLMRGGQDESRDLPPIFQEVPVPRTFHEAKTVIYNWVRAYGYAMDHPAHIENFIDDVLAPEYGEGAMQNMDGIDEHDLLKLIDDPHTPQGYVEYAKYKVRAIRARLAGDISKAMTLERICDAMHKALPDDMRW